MGAGFSSFVGGNALTSNAQSKPHFALATHTNKIYYTDGNFIGSIFPNISLVVPTLANIQSFAKYTAVTTTGTIAPLISGSNPTAGSSSARIPAFFFTDAAGTQPSNLTAGTIYYIQMTSITGGTFNVYAAASGGAAIDIAAGFVGNQYFNTFYPLSGTDSASAFTFVPLALNLPSFETATAIAEIGTNLLIGTQSNSVYPWNQIDPLPGDLIPLPENNVSSIITVNNMGYIFAGRKGNIYLTNGSAAAAVISVPDYCAGIAGTPASYIEPYFIWGGVMYLRGRVYFSILDQTSGKTGNCGGIWSFVPTQNMFFGQDTGLGLRLENQASYATYNGYSTVLLASQNQLAISPQYWNGWQSEAAGGSFGIDFTNTTTGTTALIETDLIPTGTLLDKETFKQIEYKLSTPLAVGESVGISYRQNSTDSYTSLGTAVVESTIGLSGYFPATFEKTQWLQLKITLTPLSTNSSTFVRLSEIRIR